MEVLTIEHSAFQQLISKIDAMDDVVRIYAETHWLYRESAFDVTSHFIENPSVVKR